MSLNELTKHNQRHIAVLDAFLAGKKGSDIARELDMTQCQVSLIINSPTFQHELALRRASISEKKDALIAEKQASQNDPVLERLKSDALKAANRLSLNLQDENGSVANKAAVEILDRAGYSPIRKQETTEKSLQVVISASDASLIAESLRMLQAQA